MKRIIALFLALSIASCGVPRASEVIRFGRYSDVLGGKDLARGFGPHWKGCMFHVHGIRMRR